MLRPGLGGKDVCLSGAPYTEEQMHYGVRGCSGVSGLYFFPDCTRISEPNGQSGELQTLL